MKRWIAIGVLALVILAQWGSFSAVQDNLGDDIDFWKWQSKQLEAKLNAPQACVQIREMHFEWDNGSGGKIIGQVKNFGSVDAQNVFVGVTRYKGEHGRGWVDFFWVDYLRAGENKPFELKVSKPYCDDDSIPQVELGFKTVGEYGQEWKSQIMNR